MDGWGRWADRLCMHQSPTLSRMIKSGSCTAAAVIVDTGQRQSSMGGGQRPAASWPFTSAPSHLAIVATMPSAQSQDDGVTTKSGISLTYAVGKKAASAVAAELFEVRANNGKSSRRRPQYAD
jgi:hypothetical protein